jgi:hypothetical protein
MKTPPLLILLFNCAFFFVVKQHKTLTQQSLLKVYSPFFILLYMTISTQSHIDFGVRYLLPIMPFVLLFTGVAIENLLNHKITRYLLLFGLIFQVISILLQFPYYLGYSGFVPDQKKYQVFGDSNLDWGQGIAELNVYLHNQNISSIYFDYFGAADIQYHLPNITILDSANLLSCSSQIPIIISSSQYQFSMSGENSSNPILATRYRKPDLILARGSLLFFE